MLNRFLWFAKFLLVAYAVVITVAVALAVTVGPFRESLQIWTKARLLETRFKEVDQDRANLVAERDRLLSTIQNLQASFASDQNALQALRELVKNPESEQRLIEANRITEELGRERTVLIAKLNELRLALQACTDEKNAEKTPQP